MVLLFSHSSQCFVVVVVILIITILTKSLQTVTAAFQVSQHFTISQSLLKLTSFETMMPSNHLILSCPSLHALNLDWRFVSYMILYMFQCHSPKSSHPLPLPQSPKDCSIHLCLFCYLTYRVIVTIFLNSIYMC